MTAAQLSVVALAVVIAASFFSRINVGILAVALAGPVALHVAGWSPDEVLRLFPAPLFLTLLGVTLLFGVAQVNGAMAALTHGMLRLAGGRARWVPALFFLLACAVSTVGPGAIATLALLAPLGMAA
ncbi:MAG: C4-dicarboxylate ABC transporter, partial [Gemmatimonadota bacterium]